MKDINIDVCVWVIVFIIVYENLFIRRLVKNWNLFVGVFWVFEGEKVLKIFIYKLFLFNKGIKEMILLEVILVI